ncbi:MAG: hypothetical protein KIT54_11960 [Phycisphaeraceae bacterium]|nr:hypothetical protein [Phycisphaeraceae bacterium]
MSVGSLEKPTLWVEGLDDRHTILSLLARHGISLDERKGPVILKEGKNDRGVLEVMATSAKAPTRRPVGYVIDADTSLANRWDAVRNNLRNLPIQLPEHPPPGGLIAGSPDGVYRVGVWLMPDNTASRGAIEDLLRTLIPPDDHLFAHAQRATSDARELGARFSEADHKKAELHCWLAWQRDPGRPFGTAIQAEFFKDDSPAALAFVEWFKLLYKDALEPEAATGG